VYEVSRGPLNGFAPNSHWTRVWSLARTSLNVAVKGQGHRGQKRHFSALSAACVTFMLSKASSAPSLNVYALSLFKISKLYKSFTYLLTYLPFITRFEDVFILQFEKSWKEVEILGTSEFLVKILTPQINSLTLVSLYRARFWGFEDTSKKWTVRMCCDLIVCVHVTLWKMFKEDSVDRFPSCYNKCNKPYTLDRKLCDSITKVLLPAALRAAQRAVI